MFVSLLTITSKPLTVANPFIVNNGIVNAPVATGCGSVTLADPLIVIVGNTSIPLIIGCGNSALADPAIVK
jgi:hypothetical protein